MSDPNAPSTSADAAAAVAAAAAAAAEASDGDDGDSCGGGVGGGLFDGGSAPLGLKVVCLICMERPVQVRETERGSMSNANREERGQESERRWLQT